LFSDAKEVSQSQPRPERNDKLKALGKRDDNYRKMITSG